MVLEKNLESPLDSKEIKPVNPKGNQPWIFIGRTDAEADSSTSATWLEVIVQSLTCFRLFVTPWTAACQAFLSFTSSGACSKSCPLSRWCHPTISSSVLPFSSCLQSFPASGAFLMSQFFTSGGHRPGASASLSVPPINVQDWFSLGLTGLISLQFKELLRAFSNTTIQKCQLAGAPNSGTLALVDRSG